MSKSAVRKPPGIHGFRHWQEQPQQNAREERRAPPAATPAPKPRVQRVRITTEPEDTGTAALLDLEVAAPPAPAQSRTEELAHDLRTPLTPLRSAIWLIQRYEEGHPSDPRVREKRSRLLAMMDRNIDRLIEVVDSLEAEAQAEKQDRFAGNKDDDDVVTPGVAAVHIGEAQLASA